MGFHVELNTILRSDTPQIVEVGTTYDFQKKGSRIFFDDIPIWLTRMDWMAVAEIRVTSQSRSATEIKGTFQALHVYSGDEQMKLTAIFRRMYSFPGESDPYFYLLESGDILNSALQTGFLVRDDLKMEGFIHASPANQLTRVANKHYKNVENLKCAIVVKSRVLAQIKYELATGGVYPHIFGPLNMDAVDKVVELVPNKEGEYDIDIAGMLGQSRQ